MTSISVSTYVDVDVDLSEIEDDELLDELESRGLDMNSKFVDGDQMSGLLEAIWLKRRSGKDYQKELDDMIYFGLGKIV